jgi:hypothetical protein
MSWHGMHFLNDVSPAPTSCASDTPVDATMTAAAITKCFMSNLLGFS